MRLLLVLDLDETLISVVAPHNRRDMLSPTVPLSDKTYTVISEDADGQERTSLTAHAV